MKNKKILDQEKQYKKEYYEANKVMISEKNKRYYEENKEDIIKLNKQYRHEHADRISAQRKIYREINRQKISDKRKIYYQEKRQAILNKRKQYRKYNKEKILKQNNEYTKLKLKTDPGYKLRKNISRSISAHLKRQGFAKNCSIINALPYTIEELRGHLEAIFEPWMTWESHGTYKVDLWDDSNEKTWTWQIDHIIPHSYFKYSTMQDDDFKKCWALNNLRPYSSKQNILDGAKRDVKYFQL